MFPSRTLRLPWAVPPSTCIVVVLYWPLLRVAESIANSFTPRPAAAVGAAPAMPVAPVSLKSAVRIPLLLPFTVLFEAATLRRAVGFPARGPVRVTVPVLVDPRVAEIVRPLCVPSRLTVAFRSTL